MRQLLPIALFLAMPAALAAAELVVAYGKARIVFRDIDPATYGIDYPRYYMSQTEVTNLQYHEYLAATRQTKDDTEVLEIVEKRRESGEHSTADIPYSVDDPQVIWRKGRYPDGLDGHPVALVTLIEAARFAEWLNGQGAAGLIRLPTWNEWMIAAYGSGRKFPWGDAADGRLVVASYGRSFRDRLIRPHAVGSVPGNASPEGILDLLGNVSEYLCAGDGRDREYFNLGARWMGGDYGDGYGWGHGGDAPAGPRPRNDYWGYSHHAVMRQSGVGIRLLLDPSSNPALLSRDRVFKQQNASWQQGND